MKMLPAMIVLVMCAGCFGGQSNQAKQQSAQAGDRSADTHPASKTGKDWKEAARGKGAAPPIAKEELARMEKESAPGANVSRDAGP